MAQMTALQPSRDSSRRAVHGGHDQAHDGRQPEVIPDLATAPERFLNRELSWLEFSSRLLELAEDTTLPVAERARFLGIFAQSIDEFFQVRVSGLEDQVASGTRTRSADGRTAAEQLEAIGEALAPILERLTSASAEVFAALPSVGITIATWAELDEEARRWAGEFFAQRIFPTLTPLSVDPAHPFPYISTLSLNLLLRLRDPETELVRVARVKIPPLFDRFLALPDGRWLPVEELVAAQLGALFPGRDVVDQVVFRVTRNADVTVDGDEGSDFLAAVELELHRRRFGEAVRLEVESTVPSDLLDLLVREIGVPLAHVHLIEGLLDLTALKSLVDGAGVTEDVAAWEPMVPPALKDSDLFSAIATSDVLVHHPYESFAASVEAFVRQAASDPAVVAICQTLYRTGERSAIVEALITAARRGAEVTAVIELQARFDEQANISWARTMEEAGVQVVYGRPGLKTHAKLCMVIRREDDGMRRYCHIGTGNYNGETARAYEDVGLFTCSDEIGADLAATFRLLTAGVEPADTHGVVLAPSSARRSLTALIAAEGAKGSAGAIAIKVNGLTDPEIIDALCAASRNGASVDLVVRGRCSLRPGVPGLSPTISVRSLVGRFLEHSRIYRFGGADGGVPAVYFGSLDLMERNLDRRVEVLVPARHPAVAQRLSDMLDAVWRDTANTWTLGPDGKWSRLRDVLGGEDAAPEAQFNVQEWFQAFARQQDQEQAVDRTPSTDVLSGHRSGSSTPLPPAQVRLEADPRGEQARSPWWRSSRGTRSWWRRWRDRRRA